MEFWIGFLIGCIVGAFSGVLVTGVCAIIRETDKLFEAKLANKLWGGENNGN